MDFYPFVTHTLEESMTDSPAPHSIINNTHFHTLLGLCYQGIRHHISQSIIIEDIGVEMDMFLCLADVLQEGMEEMITVGEDIHLVILKRQCPALGCKELYQGVVLLRQMKVLLFGKLQHGTFCELIHTVL